MGNSEVLTTAEIRKLNCEKIFAYIYQSRRTSKQTIAQVMGLSMPTVTQNLKVLEHLGLIERNGFYESTGGRKAQMIHCIQDARIAIGAAVLQEGLSLCAVGLCAQIIKEEQHPLPFQNTDRYYREVGRLVTAFAGGLPYPSDRILGIGIAIQGLVSPDGEQVIYGSILQNTGTTRQSFQAHLPFPCRLLHDTDAAAAAEFWHNEELRDAVYLVLNRNLGGALVIGGEIRCGWGIIEHMTLVPGGKPCYCGRLGCAEAYCSANSLRQAVLPAAESRKRQMRRPLGGLPAVPGPGRGQYPDAGQLPVYDWRVPAAVYDRGGLPAADPLCGGADLLSGISRLLCPGPARLPGLHAGRGHLLCRRISEKH